VQKIKKKKVKKYV